jgi:hypothetical protein
MADQDIIQVGPIDPALRTSDIVDAEEQGDAARATCWFNGAQYGQGAVICSAGRQLFCQSSGIWATIGKC